MHYKSLFWKMFILGYVSSCILPFHYINMDSSWGKMMCHTGMCCVVYLLYTVYTKTTSIRIVHIIVTGKLLTMVVNGHIPLKIPHDMRCTELFGNRGSGASIPSAEAALVCCHVVNWGCHIPTSSINTGM